MIVIIDNRGIVAEGYTSGFEREGVASIGIMPQEFDSWVTSISETDIGSVEAFSFGGLRKKGKLSGVDTKRCKNTPVIALNDTSSLELTLNLFAAGVDDVVRKPVHVREILVRAAAIRRRTGELKDMLPEGNIRVFFDGRAPEIGGEILELPRRERRILEFLFKNQERRVSRAQIYNAVYGLLNEGVEETVVESHISKLRKKLKVRLGYDPIDSKRYLGYMFKSGLENA